MTQPNMRQPQLFQLGRADRVSQQYGIALAGKDGAEHLQTRLAGNITDYLSQLEIHLFQGFLHMLDCS